MPTIRGSSTKILLTIKFLYEWFVVNQEKQLAKDEAFLTAVYRAYLGRAPDGNGKPFFLKQLQTGAARPIDIAHCSVTTC